MAKEEEKIPEMSIEDKKPAKNYNEEAQNIIEIISKSKDEEQFNEFAEFLGSFLELSIVKFGDETVLNHIDNIKFDFKLIRRLRQFGLVKEEEKK